MKLIGENTDLGGIGYSQACGYSVVELWPGTHIGRGVYVYQVYGGVSVKGKKK